MRSSVQLTLSSAFYACTLAVAFVLLPGARQGDLNSDGVVDRDDLELLMSRLGTRIGDPNFDARADLNGDGIVDAADLSAELHLLHGKRAHNQ